VFFRSPFFLPLLYPNLLWRVPTNNDRKLYLTFDDGPIPEVTDFVLRTLANVNVKATFFCIGENVNKHPTLFQKINDHHHVIGNHTFNHVKGWNSSTEEYKVNVERCSLALGGNEKLFRPPYGRITRDQIRNLPQYKIVMWDVLTQDYNQKLSAVNCLKGSIKATRNGSIIVFHDSLKAERNMRYTLPRYLDYFLQLGFEFDTIPIDSII
jgi:peptidoglycan/xylan/chitin deacetylase (PgdA/CDA1 family)